MLPKSSPVLSFGDGVVTMCRATAARSARGVDWTGAEGLEPYATLPYRFMRLRSDDYALQGDDAESATLKMQVRTPYDEVPVRTTDVAVVGTRAYDVTAVDGSAKGCYKYLYLTELVADGTAALEAENTTYDDLGIAHQSPTTQVVYVRRATQTDDGGTPALYLTVRACDYAGERAVVRDKLGSPQRYSVRTVAWSGEWATLTCMEGGADVGR